MGLQVLYRDVVWAQNEQGKGNIFLVEDHSLVWLRVASPLSLREFKLTQSTYIKLLNYLDVQRQSRREIARLRLGTLNDDGVLTWHWNDVKKAW